LKIKDFNQFKIELAKYEQNLAIIENKTKKALSELGEKPEFPRSEVITSDNKWKFVISLNKDLKTIELKTFENKGLRENDWYARSNIPIKYIGIIKEMLNYFE
jgi:hypothetical protein